MPNLGLHMCGHFVQILCQKASTEVGSAAAGRENKKVDKYSNLSDNYHFVPTGEKLSTFYLLSIKRAAGLTTYICS